MTKQKLLFLIFVCVSVLTSLGLFLYSYTQVDLSLTLSQQTVFRNIQIYFQHIGFYQRPLSTGMYIVVLSLLIVQFLAGYIFSHKILKEKHIWFLAAITCVILFFSYPAAFSYDIFNYIFTAKTVLLYHQNPYLVKPLDFQGIDPMLSFMRWTHLPSAYTPLWILSTFFPYLLSFNSLLFSFWTLKLVPVLFYFISLWSISRISKKLYPARTAVIMSAFALNPLILIEVFVSAHNDIVMMGFALLAFQLYLEKKKLSSFFLFSLSVASKFITIFMIPLYILKWSPRKAFLFIFIGLGLVLLRREFLPWYMVWIIPFSVLLPENQDIMPVILGISTGLLLRYAPVLYFGDYNPPVPMIQNIVFVSAAIVGVVLAIIMKSIKRRG